MGTQEIKGNPAREARWENEGILVERMLLFPFARAHVRLSVEKGLRTFFPLARVREHQLKKVG